MTRVTVPAAASARQIRKELRALAPPFAVTLFLILGFSALGDERLGSLAVAAYFFGSAAVGALSVGHEYTCRTLPMLLAQPVARTRLLLTKLLVLLPMLGALAAVATLLPLEPFDDEMAMVWMTPLAALFLSPWLTMAARNPIAGIAFSAGIPGGTWSACELIATAIRGETPEAAPLQLTLYATAGVIMCATFAVLGVRKFLALEAIDGRDAPLQLPAWLWPSRTTAAARPRPPVWMLVKKELRLQQMAFVVAGLFVVMFTAIWLAIVKDTADDRDVFTIVSALYALMLAVLVGALSSAEERHLGTLDWQIMLPFPSWRQWLIKIAVALMLALAFSVGLPSLFPTGAAATEPRFVGAILLLTSLAIYVSSRAASGVQALLISFAIAPAVALLGVLLAAPFVMRGYRGLPLYLAAAAVALLALRLGLTNYRTAR